LRSSAKLRFRFVWFRNEEKRPAYLVARQTKTRDTGGASARLWQRPPDETNSRSRGRKSQLPLQQRKWGGGVYDGAAATARDEEKRAALAPVEVCSSCKPARRAVGDLLGLLGFLGDRTRAGSAGDHPDWEFVKVVLVYLEPARRSIDDRDLPWTREWCQAPQCAAAACVICRCFVFLRAPRASSDFFSAGRGEKLRLRESVGDVVWRQIC
jgi:hypothetical protein